MYSLYIAPETEKDQVSIIPEELLDESSANLFGPQIKLIWKLYLLKDEKVWERIQEDEQNGIRYAEFYTLNQEKLTQEINAKFLVKLLNYNTYFDLEELTDNCYKYSLTISLFSDKKVYGARGMAWSDTYVMAFIHNGMDWEIDKEQFWNEKKWIAASFSKGYMEIQNNITK